MLLPSPNPRSACRNSKTFWTILLEVNFIINPNCLISGPVDIRKIALPYFSSSPFAGRPSDAWCYDWNRPPLQSSALSFSNFSNKRECVHIQAVYLSESTRRIARAISGGC